MKQGTKEWKEFRKDKIGSSDAPIIMEKSPWTTPYQLWINKLGLSSQKENAAMKRGKELESMAADLFTKKTGIYTFPRTIVHPERSWMIASLDGMDVERKTLVEIKCLNKEDHELAKSGKIPEKYLPQLQHQLEVSGLDNGYYFSFDGEDGVIVEFEKDENFIKELVEKEELFLECVLTFTPPKLNQKDYIKQDSLEYELLANEWIEIKKDLEEKEEMIKDIENKKQEIEKKLFNVCEERNSIGCGIKIMKYFKKGNIEYKEIPEFAKVDLEKYRKPGIFIRKISLQ